jgi:AcrR family transcriptional regulator
MRRFLVPEDSADPRELKRRRMVTEATALFLHYGYKKTSMGDVARAAGVAKGTVYLYFESKADLLLHAVVAEKAGMAGEFLDLMEEQDPRRRLHGFLLQAFAAFERMPLSTRFTERDQEFMDALNELDPALLDLLMSSQQETLEHLVGPLVRAHGGSDQDVRDRSAVLAGLMYGVPAMMREAASLGLPPSHHARILADLMVAGFDAPLPAPKAS